MSLKTIIASVTLVFSMAPEAGADWEKIQETEAGDFYTSVASSNVSANVLVVYFRAKQRCAPELVIFDYYDIEPEKTEAWDDLKNQRFDSVVSLGASRILENSSSSAGPYSSRVVNQCQAASKLGFDSARDLNATHWS